MNLRMDFSASVVWDVEKLASIPVPRARQGSWRFSKLMQSRVFDGEKKMMTDSSETV